MSSLFKNCFFYRFSKLLSKISAPYVSYQCVIKVFSSLFRQMHFPLFSTPPGWFIPSNHPLSPSTQLSLPKQLWMALLEQGQYKNDSTEFKCMLILKLPPLSPHRIAEWKRAAISKQTFFWSPSSRSYIILALEWSFSCKMDFHRILIMLFNRVKFSGVRDFFSLDYICWTWEILFCRKLWIKRGCKEYLT